MKRSNINKYIILLILVLSLAITVGCGRQQETAEAEETIRPVKYQKVELKKRDNNYSYSGPLKAEVDSNFAFRVAGKIDKFLVGVGDRVEQGEKLAQLDKSDYRLKVDSIKSKLQQAETSVHRAESKVAQAKAEITSAKSKLHQAENNYQRIRKLYQNDNVSKSDYDKARTGKEMAAAKLELAKAKLKEAQDGVEAAKSTVKTYQKQLESAELKLQYTDLKAHMSGVIAAKHKEAGEVVDAGMPVLTIDSDGGLEVRVFVDENFISKINKGDNALVSVKAVNRDQIKAKVTEIGRNAAGYQGNYPVTVKLTEEAEELKAGMTAVVNFQQLQEQRKIIVETTAVGSDHKGNFVYTIEQDDGNYARVKKSRVETGAMTEEGLEIVSGLEEGSLIVTKGVSRIADGQKVRLLN